MTRPPMRIRWKKPTAATLSAFEEFEQPVRTPEQLVIRQTLLRVGVPVVEGATTAREAAIELLKLAAEVEHALMVQYLYAAYSLPDESSPDSVNYHEKLKRIAVQEMGHLATVQNLLLILGGPAAFHMQRDVLRQLSEKNPLPFVVERVSEASLAKYVVAEMPAEVPDDLKELVEKLIGLAKADAGKVLHRVGAIYAVLKWMFMPPEEAEAWLGLGLDFLPAGASHLTDADLRPQDEIAAFEARRGEWRFAQPDLHLDAPRTCAKAVEALDSIARQGEGLSNEADSHFQQFVQIFNQLGSLSVKQVAKSPTLGGGHGPKGGKKITNRYTNLWGRVFVLQYNSLVLTIYVALSTPRREDGEEGLREGLADLALLVMRRVVGSVSELLSTLPLNNTAGSGLAGPPYDLDPTVLEPADSDALTARLLGMLDELEGVYKQIVDAPAATPEHLTLLENLRNFDQQRRDLLAPPPPDDN